MTVIPWPMGLVADHLSDGGAEAATALFSGVFLAMGLTSSATWHRARALALAFVAPVASLAVNFAVAFYYLLPDRAGAFSSYRACGRCQTTRPRR